MSMNTDELITNIINGMTPYLDSEQMGHLKNVLFMQLRGKNITQDSTELVVSELSDNERLIRMFVASKRMANISEGTLKQYVTEIRKVLATLNKEAKDVTAMDLRCYYSILQENGQLSARSVQGRLHYLSSFFEFLVTEGFIKSNPVRKVGKVKVEKIIKQPFSAEDMEKLRMACKNERDRAMIEFLYSTGVRVSEMTALNIGDIDLTQEELIVYGKGGKERKTYLTNSAAFYLKLYLKTRTKNEDYEKEPLFVTLKNPHRRMTNAGVEYMLHSLGNAAGVENVHPHRFRRTIATNLLNRGMPIEEVKEFLGHEKMETTLIYCTVLDENVHASHRKCS